MAAPVLTDVIAATRNRARIVVIDDDVVVRALLKLHLSSAGYDVLEAEDAVAGGYLVLRSSPDLIISDVDMPYMDGYELTAALKSDPRTQEIPVVLLSAHDDVQDARKLGVVAYLRKPILANRLLEVVALFTTRSG